MDPCGPPPWRGQRRPAGAARIRRRGTVKALPALRASDRPWRRRRDRPATGELIIRGGTHYEFRWIPNVAFPATLRGADAVAWYTTAWFDKYVKGDASADARLLTNRWRSDAPEAAIDPNHDGNNFSFYYRSRLDIGLAGDGRFDCEDMRRAAPVCSPTTANPATTRTLRSTRLPTAGANKVRPAAFSGAMPRPAGASDRTDAVTVALACVRRGA